ncbi:MAG TPA: discoidin domain-containing protein [Actinoplanes sp.]|nr:discoidin domain-containing protein [Actinoplanes sp.]
MSPTGLTRRQLLALTGAAGGALALPAPASGKPAHDPVADLYHELLLFHTRWVERQWDSTIGAYRAADFAFVAVLGNAVLLTTDGYDAGKAGVDRTTLRSRTLATIKRFAATNRLAGGTEWGKQLFWDSTFELYFVLAARLLWHELDERTRGDVRAITIRQAAYAYQLGIGDDPLSAGWSPHGREGGWIGDTKLEEMGVYAQALAPGIAWAEDDGWRDRFTFWMSNASGLPVADRANPAVKPRNTAHNIHDTFIVENHGSTSPHYQAELWRIAGRAAIHFLAAGRPLPPVLTRQPNGRELWSTLMLLASDAGEPVMPMVADRYHLYGRDVLPLAFLAQVQGDANAARAEADLAARLMPSLRYEPEYRLTKFTGENKYEPEARAELAISCLLHRGNAVKPASREAFFRTASGTRNFGDDIGMTVQQSENAFAAAVTKKGFVNFLWQPGHDNWLVDTRAVAFLPPSASPPTASWTTAYRKSRDGVDATATVLTFGEQYAGFTTLPTGTVVYASTGVGADEGGLTIFNASMPGVPGLVGSRTFRGASGTYTLAGSRGGGGDGGADELAFPPRQARYVRMLGREAATEYGYSIWTFSVLDTAGADLAQGAVATGSSAHVTYPARNATDGNPETRWAVAREDRGRVDSWLAVDLGSTVTVAGVRLLWEAAYATKYVIQTSTDAVTWTDVVRVPDARILTGGWVDIDGRAGLVTHESYRPITVSATGVIAAAGPAAATTVEGYAGGTVDLARAANRPLPATTSRLRLNDADGYLSVFNLTPDPIVEATVWIPSTARLYRGTQVVRDDGLDWTVSQAAATARVEPPRFTIDGTPPPPGTRFDVPDSQDLTITAPIERPVALTVRSGSWSATVRLPAGRIGSLRAPGGPVTPTTDLARGRTTFPTSPLPAGMTAPDFAVDGDPRTAWRPGPSGRMVVDLGEVRDVALIRLAWTAGWVCPVRLESSTDGLTYAAVDLLPRRARSSTSAVQLSARYLAVHAVGWRTGDAELVELAVE